MTLSTGVAVEVFTLANPYRVILDMPDVSFELPKTSGQSGKGLISAYRYGLFAARKARVVIDTVLPVSIDRAVMTPESGGAVKLQLSLVAIDAGKFGAGTGASRTSKRPTLSARKAAESPPGKYENGRDRRRPVVVIDPGHGGVDPGTLGPSNVYEKDVVLAVAKELLEELNKLDRFDVAMTRTEDVFVSLDDRLEFSSTRTADLFLSLHADAIADKRYVAQTRGATVYTLSDRASDEAARRMAEKENSADAIAGLASFTDEAEGGVRDILIDLVKRETANFSMALSNSLVGRLKESARLSSKPQRSAAFKVLRQTGTPSVLVELGYLSNKEDEKRLTSPDWRRKVAKSIAAAVGIYFDRRTALAR
ncbi:MAG: N-acetylmuramoyl-L-alanine amidase [Alphaproteobacteria bacterium]|nr:N-acetylmuramoyl-L-alanine amidase [Alphaproteobacteria bacterium]